MSYIPELIHDLVQNNRVATDTEIKQLTDYVGRAPFSSRPLKMNRWLRTELSNRGVPVSSAKRPSVEIHLLKRIYLDEQWSSATTSTQFISDLHTAITHTDCRIWTYELFGEVFAGFIAPSHIHNVPKPEKFVFVAYSADYDKIKTGYQTSGPDAIFTDDFQRLVRHR
ncbi:MAG: hypothetical protein AAF639_34835 [Chloroflexota bacterium]